MVDATISDQRVADDPGTGPGQNAGECREIR